MCGRYTLFTPDQIPARFDLPKESADRLHLSEHYNVGPGMTEPVIVERRTGKKLEMMQWGYQPPWSRDKSTVYRYKTFNARSEGVFEKPMWRQLIRYRRCLVPANGFYEWQKVDDGKQPYFIRPSADSLFAFAGIYGYYKDDTGREHGSFSILTTEASDAMKSLHDRMPVILHPDMESAWLDKTLDEPEAIKILLKPYTGNLRVVPVSRDVNTTKVNAARLVEPINSV